MNVRFLVLLSFVILFTACSKESSPPSEQSLTTQEATPSQAASTPKSAVAPTASAPAASNTVLTPPSMVATPPAEPAEQLPGTDHPPIEGVVASIIEVPDSKTMYLEVESKGKMQWVGAKLSGIKKGDRVRVAPGAVEMQNFTSKSLGRTFDMLLLASDVEKLE